MENAVSLSIYFHNKLLQSLIDFASCVNQLECSLKKLPRPIIPLLSNLRRMLEAENVHRRREGRARLYMNKKLCVNCDQRQYELLQRNN